MCLNASFCCEMSSVNVVHWRKESLSVLQHDGQPYCHKPCYAVLFGPKGMKGDTGKKLICFQLHSDPFWSVCTSAVHEYLHMYADSLHVCCCDDDDPSWCIIIPTSGVNTGGVGSYIYDDPVEETQPWALPGWSDKPCAPLYGNFRLSVVFVYSLYRFLNRRRVHFWVAFPWFCLPNVGQYRPRWIITFDESSWFKTDDWHVDVLWANTLLNVHCCEVVHTTFSTVNRVMPNGRSVSVDYFSNSKPHEK